MTKLNYSNRKSTGDKLGQIVAKDIRKLLPSSINKSTSYRKNSALEIVIPGKELTDTGLREIALALQNVLEEVVGGPAASLEELNFSGNVLTAKSLAYLAPVIELAAQHLRDIDLSNNAISVADDASATKWEAFLSSFHSCCALRRLELSRNDLSGPLAFELFSKVYGRQKPVDPADLPSEDLSNDSQFTLQSRIATLRIVEPTNDDNSKTSLTNAKMFNRRQGLRAIPYIVVSETNMTDSGALFLSYVLPEHYYPRHLDVIGKPGPFETQLEEYSENTTCSGLVYLPNDGLSTSGERTLNLAESIRRQLLSNESASPRLDHAYSFSRRTSGQHKHMRRGSFQFLEQGQSSDTRNLTSADLESMRKKLQRTEIEQNGVHGVQLWKASIRLLVVARQLCHPYKGLSMRKVSPLPTQLGLHHLPSFRQSLTKPVRDIWDYFPRTESGFCPFGLPDDLWRTLVIEGAMVSGQLNPQQIDAVTRWASDRSNLVLEGQMLGKDVSTQIWTVLRDMGCLMYSQVV